MMIVMNIALIMIIISKVMIMLLIIMIMLRIIMLRIIKDILFLNRIGQLIVKSINKISQLITLHSFHTSNFIHKIFTAYLH